MAVSGSKDYAITRADIIEAAYAKTGDFDAGETISGDETKRAAAALNAMVKAFVTQGADIWLRDDITVFLAPDTQVYPLGTTNATRTITGETTLSSSAAASATVLPVADDNSIHWTTIVSVDNATQVTITTGLASAAASGKKVYAYTTKAGRPTKIEYAFRRDINGIDNEVDIIGEKEYKRQSNKASSGPPVEVWYQPTLTTGSLYVWPVDGGANWDKLILVAKYYPDDFDAAGDNPQFPIEWGEALIYNLADRLAPETGLPLRERILLKNEAKEKLNDALDFDVENASVIFTMDYER
jgi:hypothetical protein